MEWLVPILDAVLGSLVRSALMMITGFLLERHLVSQQIADQFVSDGVTHVIIAVPALLAFSWSVWVKVRGRARFLTALQATPGTTEDQVKAKVSAGMGVSVKAGAVLLACVLGGAAASACGPKQYHTAVVANTSIAQAIFALQDAEIAAHQAKLVTDAKHAEYKAQILTLLQAGDDLTLALRAWDPAQPVPANVGVAIGNVQRLLADLQVNSPQASALLYTVQTVLSVLRGTGVLPGDAPENGAERQQTLGLRNDANMTVARIVYGRDSHRFRLTVGGHNEVLADDVLAGLSRERNLVDVAFRRRTLDGEFHALILLPEVARG